MSDAVAPDILLSARALGRHFGYRVVFEGVNLDIARGDGLLIMGPNGTGKTTLLRVLSGLLRPSKGTIERHGSVELVAHEAMIYDALTARENLEFFARLRGGRVRQRVEPILEQVGLGPAADRVVGRFSRGMRQRVAIGRALVNAPEVLLLDEPFTGLDRDGTARVSGLIADIRRDQCAVVMVTHDPRHDSEVASQVVFVVNGGAIGPEPIGTQPDALDARYAEVLAGG